MASRIGTGRLRWLMVLSLAVLGGVSAIQADEGQWPPDQLHELDWENLARRGLKLDPQEIWNAEDGGLMAAVLRLNGCSASFVSPDGLIATNHHCAYRAIQGASTVADNYLEDGFLARRWAEEPEARGYKALILTGLQDVTAEIEARLAVAEDDHARFLAREDAIKSLVAECEARPGVRCRVGSEFGGLRYVLLESLELNDIRLVYAPPDAIGRFGGEVDNWMWPRHTGDFSLLRAYVDPEGGNSTYAPENVPYRPARHLQVSSRGVRPGDLVMVMGYPGSTARYLPASAIAFRQDFYYPERVETYAHWMDLLQKSTEDRPDGALRVAPLLRSLGNRLKNARGMMVGLRRNEVLPQKRTEELDIAEWIAADEARAERYGGLLDELGGLYLGREEEFRRDYLMQELARVSRTFSFARRITINARERELPDAQRKRGYQERDQERLRSSIKTGQDTLDVAADLAVTNDVLERLMALPPAAAAPGLAAALAPGAAESVPAAQKRPALTARVAAMYDGTGLIALESRMLMMDLSRAELEQSADPFIKLALALESGLDALEKRDETRKGALSRLLPDYALLLKERRLAVYPDANATLRLSVATVKGYAPADAVWMEPQTTLTGLLDKDTGATPFAVPEKVRQKSGTGRWRQAGLDDLPLCFLSDADTTGGNSGSPVVDGQGRLVGLNFDRVFENIAGDYGYNTARSRNVSVDVRFLLWMLESVDEAWPILREMGIKPRAMQPAAGD